MTDVAILIPIESSASSLALAPLSSFMQDAQSVLGSKLRYRLYELLELSSSISLPLLFDMGELPHFLVINGMTPAPGFEKTFNDWYEEEHIPLLSQVPSWISSTRFKLVAKYNEPEPEIDLEAPQYIALHRWRDLSAFETSQYKIATNTVWRTEIMEHILAKERFVMEWKGTSNTSKSSVTKVEILRS